MKIGISSTGCSPHVNFEKGMSFGVFDTKNQRVENVFFFLNFLFVDPHKGLLGRIYKNIFFS